MKTTKIWYNYITAFYVKYMIEYYKVNENKKRNTNEIQRKRITSQIKLRYKCYHIVSKSLSALPTLNIS